MWTESGLRSFRFAELDWQAQGCAQCLFVVRDFVSLKKSRKCWREERWLSHSAHCIGTKAGVQIPSTHRKSLMPLSLTPLLRGSTHPVAEGVHTDGQIPGALWLASLVDGVSCFVSKTKVKTHQRRLLTSTSGFHTQAHKSHEHRVCLIVSLLLLLWGQNSTCLSPNSRPATFTLVTKD